MIQINVCSVNVTVVYSKYEQNLINIEMINSSHNRQIANLTKIDMHFVILRNLINAL